MKMKKKPKLKYQWNVPSVLGTVRRICLLVIIELTVRAEKHAHPRGEEKGHQHDYLKSALANTESVLCDLKYLVKQTKQKKG